jgi:hypothetical protein
MGSRSLPLLLIATILLTASCGSVQLRFTNATTERLKLLLITLDSAGKVLSQEALRSVRAGEMVTRRFDVPPGSRFQIEAYTGDFLKDKSWKSAPMSADGSHRALVVRPENLMEHTFYLRLGPR